MTHAHTHHARTHMHTRTRTTRKRGVDDQAGVPSQRVIGWGWSRMRAAMSIWNAVLMIFLHRRHILIKNYKKRNISILHF